MIGLDAANEENELKMDPKGEQTRSFADLGYSTVNIPQWSDGMSDHYKIDVADGHTVDSMTMSMESQILPRYEEFSWEQGADFNDSRADFENIQHNDSGIKVLPQGVLFDFENGTGSQWSLASGSWSIGQDTGLSGARVTSGSNALYTYTGSYPNYLSTTYWATSPSINCSHCSGGWELSFQRRLGIESYYYDHAYIQVKNPSGNWASLWSHSSSTINEGSFSKQTYTISSYIANNPDFQIRFGIGSTDGSVTYTGWNIDDVMITPTSGVSNQGGWWQSPSFGHANNADLPMAPGPYGLMSMVGVFPTGSTTNWSVLDSDTGTPIPGFVDRNELVMDLGTIDWLLHPAIKFKIELNEGSGGSPWIKSINMMGRWRSEFIQYVVDDGWYLENCSWIQASGSGELRGNSVGKAVPPVFDLARPTSRIATDITSSGPVEFGFYDFDGIWKPLPNKGVSTLAKPMSHIQFEIRSQSGTWSIDEFTIDLNGGGMPQNLSIDIGHDGFKEWSISDSALGWLGHQQRFANGANSHQMTLTPNNPYDVEVVLPQYDVYSLSLEMVPMTVEVTNLEVEVIVDGNSIAARQLNDLEDSALLVLNEQELDSLSSGLENSTNTIIGATLDTSRITFRFNAAAGDLLIRGLSTIQYPTFEVDFTSDSSLLMAVNDLASDNIGSSNSLLLPLTVTMSLPGSVKIGLLDVEISQSSITTILSWSNNSDTLTASENWLEVQARHQVYNGTMIGAQFDVINADGRTSFIQYHDGNVSLLYGDGSLIELSDEVSPATMSGNEVLTNHRFQISRDWDDEEWVDIRIRPLMNSGIRGLSNVEKFGQGPLKGVENDIEVTDWWVRNSVGERVPLSSPYLKTDSWVDVLLKMKFEDTVWQTPRIGEVDVELFLDGVSMATGTVDSNGLVTLPVLVPSSAFAIEFTLDVSAGQSQEIIWLTADNQSFITDSLAPTLLASNIRFHDHRPSSQSQYLEFTIGDVPVLPNSATLMLWRSWLDDLDDDGIPDEGEHFAISLNTPSVLNESQGIYYAHINDLSAAQGEKVSGFLIASDPAGNELNGGGGPGSDNHLFMYQIKNDGSPLVHSASAGHVEGRKSWMHPGEMQHMQFPFDEPNGRSDVSTIRVELASTIPTAPMAVLWSSSDGMCVSSDSHLEVISCGLLSRTGDSSPYATDLVFDLKFKIRWEMQPDPFTYREPTVEVTDRASQSSYSILPHLRWRFSTDLMIDTSSISVGSSGEGVDASGAWVKPGQSISVSGLVRWEDSGELTTQTFDVLGRFRGFNIWALSENGSFNFELTMPAETGEHPLVLSLGNLPAMGNDVTDRDEATIWFVVDATAPRISDVLSPRPDSVIPLDSLDSIEVEFRIHEDIQMSGDDLVLNWRLRESDTNSLPLAEGSVNASVADARSSGSAIPVLAVLEIESIVDIRQFENQVILEVWVTGYDAAGNEMSRYLNSDESPMASWNVELVQPVFVLSGEIGTSSDGVAFVGEDLVIDLNVLNEGRMNGTVRVRVEAVDIDLTSKTIFDSDIGIESGQTELVRVDWHLKKNGEYTMVIYLDDVVVGESEEIQIRHSDDDSWLTGSIGEVNPIFVWILGLLLLALLVVLGVFMRSSGDDSESLLYEEDHYLGGDDFHPQQVPSQDQYVPVAVQQVAVSHEPGVIAPYAAAPQSQPTAYSGQVDPYASSDPQYSPYAPQQSDQRYHQ